MTATRSTMQRPQRWDQPLAPEMTGADVDRLLTLAPFSAMDASQFSKSVSLRGILQNDCRIHNLDEGDIIVREGDYGSSAFFIIEGSATVSLVSLPEALLGRKIKKQRGWASALAQLWTNSRHPETRDYDSGSPSSEHVGLRDDANGARMFLHDVPRIVPPGKSIKMGAGEIFGEISALTRTPRSATVIASSGTQVLEIRWQGFRELLKRHSALRLHVEELYRTNSLRTHLREALMLQSLPTIDEVANETSFESFGDFQWNREFRTLSKKDIAERILAEPVIAEQGEYADGLILIRNGFARLSRLHGDGHQTIAYLGKGEVFGLRELAHNWRTGEQRPWSLGLRAVGYVDILRIPSAVVEQSILPHFKSEQLPPLLPKENETGKSRRKTNRSSSIDNGLLEFLVENRFINGKQTMMIDLDRCTRCDDCVRACASAHDNNPRFIRQGAKQDHWMIANACMHCLDPVCMIGCPTGAIGRDRESGNVMINDDTCIGCGTCANSCPYSNILMVEINDRAGRPLVDPSDKPILKATKCDLCSDQLGGPACQRACPHDALVRIDMTQSDNVAQWSKD